MIPVLNLLLCKSKDNIMNLKKFINHFKFYLFNFAICLLCLSVYEISQNLISIIKCSKKEIFLILM